jgi:hypothetical protein
MAAEYVLELGNVFHSGQVLNNFQFLHKSKKQSKILGSLQSLVQHGYH